MIRAALLASLLLASACADLGVPVERPRVTLRRVEVTGVDFAGVSTVVQLTVENPNDIALDVVKLSWRVKLADKLVLEGGTDQKIHVPPRVAGEVPVPVRVTYRGLFDTLEAMASQAQVPVTMHLEVSFGTTHGILTIPVDAKGVLPVARLPEINVASADVTELGVSGAAVDVALALRNPNGWPLPVGSLSFQLLLDDTPIAKGVLDPLTLPANASQLVHAKLSIDFLAVGASAVAAISSGAARLTLDGKLPLGTFVLPLRASVTLRR